MRNVRKLLSISCTMVLSTALLLQSPVTYCNAEVNNTNSISTEIPKDYTPIYTIADLVGINSNSSGKYILMNDIDMTNETSPGGSWDTGHGWTPLNTFSGVFDGNGHRIIGMHIYGEFKGYTKVGLFGSVSKYNDVDADDRNNRNDRNYGIVKNLGILNCDINVKVNGYYSPVSGSHIYSKAYIGAITADNDGGTIQNCYVNGTIKATINDGSGDYIGGIIGYNSGTIINCYNTADVSVISDSSLTDVAGIANYSAPKNCYNIGKITLSNSDFTNRQVASPITYYGYNTHNYYLNTSILTDDEYYFGTRAEDYFGGKPLTDAQMRYSSSFTGFDFNDTWFIDELSSYPYPQLKSCSQIRVDKLELKNLPNKLTYSQGDELDLSGAILSITYEDGVVTSTKADKSMVSGIDIDSIGEQTAIIQYLNGVCSFDVTVNEVEVKEITLPKAEYSINRNDKLQLNAVIKPNNASNKSVKWETDNDVVATVTQNGVVHGINPGTATITVTTENGVEASCIVTVKVPASSIKLNVKKLTLKKGKTKKLKATVNPLETTDTVKWTSNDSKVATVTQDGVVKAKKKGYATIMAKTTSGKYASVEITVKK